MGYLNEISQQPLEVCTIIILIFIESERLSTFSRSHSKWLSQYPNPDSLAPESKFLTTSMCCLKQNVSHCNMLQQPVIIDADADAAGHVGPELLHFDKPRGMPDEASGYTLASFLL